MIQQHHLLTMAPMNKHGPHMQTNHMQQPQQPQGSYLLDVLAANCVALTNVRNRVRGNGMTRTHIKILLQSMLVNDN